MKGFRIVRIEDAGKVIYKIEQRKWFLFFPYWGEAKCFEVKEYSTLIGAHEAILDYLTKK